MPLLPRRRRRRRGDGLLCRRLDATINFVTVSRVRRRLLSPVTVAFDLRLLLLYLPYPILLVSPMLLWFLVEGLNVSLGLK